MLSWIRKDERNGSRLFYCSEVAVIIAVGISEVAGQLMNDLFYKSKKWKKKRAKILRRDKYLCQYCLRYGRRREAVTVHHIKHIDEEPELALADENLISLCRECHNRAHPEKGGNRQF